LELSGTRCGVAEFLNHVSKSNVIGWNGDSWLGRRASFNFALGPTGIIEWHETTMVKTKGVRLIGKIHMGSIPVIIPPNNRFERLSPRMKIYVRSCRMKQAKPLYKIRINAASDDNKQPVDSQGRNVVLHKLEIKKVTMRS